MKRDSFLFSSVCKTCWNTTMIIARHNALKISYVCFSDLLSTGAHRVLWKDPITGLPNNAPIASLSSGNGRGMTRVYS